MGHSVLNSGPSGPRPSGSGARAPSVIGKTLPGLAQLAEATDTFQVTKLSTRLGRGSFLLELEQTPRRRRRID